MEQKKRFYVEAQVVVTYHQFVEAKNEREARRLAEKSDNLAWLGVGEDLAYPNWETNPEISDVKESD